MKLETFFEKFELFAEAPGAVERMRELVLDLAATGRLLTNKSKWEKHLLKSVTTKIGSGATPAGGRESYFSEGIPLIRSMNVHFRGFEKDGLVFLSDEQANGLSNAIVQANDVLLNITGASIGRVTIAPTDIDGARVNQHVTIIRPTPELLPRFLSFFLASPSVQQMIDNIQVGATRQALTKGMIEKFEIPLPPLAEQKQVVAKADELMALCDRLEKQQQERGAQRAMLTHASLARFAEAPTPANLACLFHPSYDVTPADLRKSILTLAVQGKLVAQTTDDKLTRVSTNNQLDGEFDVPESWTWISLADMYPNFQNGVSSRGDKDGISVVVIRLADIKDNKISLDSNRELIIATDQISRFSLRTGDILITRVNGSADIVGTFTLVQEETNAIYCDHFIRMRINPELIFPAYTALVGESPLLREQIKNLFITTAGQKTVNQEHIRSLRFPLPPLAEQRRIVAKVDELMALVDQLEAQLVKEKSAGIALLNSAIHELLNSSADFVAYPATQVAAIDRAGIGCYVVQKLAGHKTFGRVALMKHEYLAEAHVGATLDGQYHRQAAGPLDNWVYRFEEDAAREGWFTVEETKTRDGHKKIVYRKGPELDAKASDTLAALPKAQRDELDRILKLLGGKPTEEIEIIATLFAVWNDFLIDGHSPSDENIVTGFREHWHEKKQKFTAKSLHTWLDWMRRNDLVPTGRGPRTQQHAKLDLH